MGEGRLLAANPFNNVNDYAGYAQAGGITDIGGLPIPNLAAYAVSVLITPLALGAVPAAESSLITVTVSVPDGNAVVLNSFRTEYAPNQP